jgi:hypothetical protein
MANGIGRLGGVFMPWVCYFLYDIHYLLPFLSMKKFQLRFYESVYCSWTIIHNTTI